MRLPWHIANAVTLSNALSKYIVKSISLGLVTVLGVFVDGPRM